MIKIGRGSTKVYPEPTSNPTFAPRTVEQHERDLMVFQLNTFIYNIYIPIEFVFSYRLFWVLGNASTELKALLHFWLFWILITSRRKYPIICIVSATEESSFWWPYELRPNTLNNLGT